MKIAIGKRYVNKKNGRVCRIVNVRRWTTGTREHCLVEYRYTSSAESRSKRGIILYRINNVQCSPERFERNFEEA